MKQVFLSVAMMVVTALLAACGSGGGGGSSASPAGKYLPAGIIFLH